MHLELFFQNPPSFDVWRYSNGFNFVNFYWFYFFLITSRYHFNWKEILQICIHFCNSDLENIKVELMKVIMKQKDLHVYPSTTQ